MGMQRGRRMAQTSKGRRSVLGLWLPGFFNGSQGVLYRYIGDVK